jgi:hypothetical protein
MYRVRTCASRRVQDDVAAKVTFLRARSADVHGLITGRNVRRMCVGVRVDGDRANAEPPRGTRDSAGDFAAIGDEQGAEHVYCAISS